MILIGDAPPNSKAEVERKRKRFGENYWRDTKFAQSIFYESQLSQLKADEIPVHTFFVTERAETAFEEIASQTRGHCEMLDINSYSGAEMLTNLVIEEVLHNIRENALVGAYRNKYAKSYI